LLKVYPKYHYLPFVPEATLSFNRIAHDLCGFVNSKVGDYSHIDVGILEEVA